MIETAVAVFLGLVAYQLWQEWRVKRWVRLEERLEERELARQQKQEQVAQLAEWNDPVALRRERRQGWFWIGVSAVVLVVWSRLG